MENKDDDDLRVTYKPSPQSLQANRYVSDLTYQKEGLYVHKLKNFDPKERSISNILIQDSFPRNLRP